MKRFQDKSKRVASRRPDAKDVRPGPAAIRDYLVEYDEVSHSSQDERIALREPPSER